MKPITTIIPEHIVTNTLIETDVNEGVSCVEFLNCDLSLEKVQAEQYDYRYATLDCFKDEYEDDSDGFHGIFLKGYETLKEARVGHRAIVAEILAKGKGAECLQ